MDSAETPKDASIVKTVGKTLGNVGKKIIKKTKEFIDKPIMRDNVTQQQYKDAVDSGTSNKLESVEYEKSDWRQELDEKCWPGYEKKGMKTMFGKRYPNCVKKSKKKK